MKQKLLFTIAAIAIAFTSSAQTTFYNSNTIQTIKIYFPFSNWDYRLDTASAGADGFAIADSVIVNGKHFDSVGVKYKGNSSNSASNKKNPFHIALDEVKTNQDYQGYTDIKLGNGFSDPSMVREATAYTMLRRYMDAPQCNFATVYVNDVWRGIYSNAESINKDFVGNKYYSKNGDFFKCNPQYGSGGVPNLVPNGWDSVVAYPNRYEMKSLTGWSNFIQFHYDLTTNPTLLKSTLDIDRALWMHAFNNVLVNLDSYTGAFAQNYYMYRDANNLWIPTVWDLNMCFGSFTNLGAGNNLNIAGMQNMNNLVQSTNANRPLISQLLSNATYKKMYVAHCKTILQESMQSATGYYSVASATQNLIKDSVAVDSLLFYTYAKFLANIDTAVITTGTSTKVGLKQLMEGRAAYWQSTAEYMAAAPSISNIASVPSTVPINTNVTIKATISTADSVYLGYRNVASVPFTRIQMYDDGTHGDGAAADGVYGVSILANSGKIDYYIYAQNANAAMFSPQRAEHEFHTLLPTIATVSNSSLVINEILPSNTSAALDPAGEYDDFIELYNKSNASINLSGLYLSDDASNLTKWAFPSTATIGALNYAMVWADQDAFQSGNHCNFKLSSAADQVYLSYANGTIIDSVKYASAVANKSFGRCANGVGAFVTNNTATPNGSNTCVVAVQDVAPGAYAVYPNPASDVIFVQSTFPIQHLALYNTQGMLLAQKNCSHIHEQIDIKGLPAGVYLLQVDKHLRYKVIVQ